MYSIEYDLKFKMRKAGLCTRDIANALNMPCGSVATKLNGFTVPFTKEERKIILTTIEQAEACKAIACKNTESN